MPIKIIVLFISAAFSFNAHAAAKIEQWRTSQGVKVLYTHTPSLPMVDIEVTFDAGSARDGKQHGIASLTSTLLKTGAGKWNADQIAARFESVGAQFHTGAGIDSATLSLRTLTEAKLLNKSLETMQVVLTQPIFAKVDFERDQKRVLAGIKQREESPAALASLAFNKAVFGQHPYAYSSSGYADTVTKLTPANLKAFYQQYYVTANAMVVIVGDVNKAHAEKIAEQLIAGLPKGQKPSALADVKLPEKATRQSIIFPSTQTHILVGMTGMHRKDPDYFALYMGNHILGGSGLVSKMFKEIREKRGLAYSAYSYFSPRAKKGAFTLGLQTKNSQTQQALKVLNQTLNDFIEKGITEAELIAAKKNITGGFVMRFDTNRKLMSYLSMIGFHDLPLDYLETFPQKIDALTVADIQEAFKRRVIPSLLQTITVGGSDKQDAK